MERKRTGLKMVGDGLGKEIRKRRWDTGDGGDGETV